MDLVKISFLNRNEYIQVQNILGKSISEVISDNDVYLVNISGKEFYHLNELGDGDFIGMDSSGILYKITHDPLNIEKLEGNALDIFEEEGDIGNWRSYSKLSPMAVIKT